MSGGYSLPYLFKDPPGVLKHSRGFVPIAPVHTSAYTVEKYKSLNVSTNTCIKKLIVYIDACFVSSWVFVFGYLIMYTVVYMNVLMHK